MNLKNIFKRVEFQSVVFITGIAILVLEILATRLFAPYFGNTIFSISSILSVVLLALALGYYLGGLIADKYPETINFYRIVLISGLISYGIYILDLCLLPTLSEKLSITTGPLVASSLMLFLPCILMGLLCPYAIKLLSLRFPNLGIGKLSGEIFFWSTTGSISGSLLTGFYFIPNFRIDYIIIVVASILTFIGLLGIISNKKKAGSSTVKILLLLALISFVTSQFILTNKLQQKNNLKILYSSNGIYEKIQVYDGVANNQPARFLIQDRTQSGAVYLENYKSAYEYADYFEIFKLFKPQLSQVAVLGGGAYIIPQALLNYVAPNGEVEVAEIEPELFALSQKYFGVSHDPRIKNHIIDGRRFLKQSPKQYDLIFCDVYRSLYSMPTHFTTIEFFKEVKSKLTSDGLLLTNIIGNLRKSKKSFTFSLMKTIKHIFPNTTFIVLNDLTVDGFQNIIAISSHQQISMKDLKLLNWEYLKEKEFERKLVPTSENELANYQLLTDKFAPVDYLVAQGF